MTTGFGDVEFDEVALLCCSSCWLLYAAADDFEPVGCAGVAIAEAGTRSAAALQARTSDGVIDSSRQAVNCIIGDMTTGSAFAAGAAAGAVWLNPSASSPVAFGAFGSSFLMHSWLLKNVQPYDSPEEVMVLAPNTQRYEFTHVFSSEISEQSFNFPP